MPSPPQLVVRCDADDKIGLGHAARALTLAEALSVRLGARPVIVARESRLLDRFLVGRDVQRHAHMEAGYALDTVLEIVEPGAILVTDSYELTPAVLHSIAAADVRHVVIDDFAPFQRWPCDVVVNPNVGAVVPRYRGPRRVLVGPRYALVRREIVERRPLRTGHRNPSRVVVSLGGSDWGKAGRGLLEALAELAGERTHVRVTTTATCPEPLEAVAPSTIAQQLAWADVAVLGGGVTKYEAACVGLPALLVAVVPQQAEVAATFARAGGGALYVGELERVAPRAVADVLGELLDQPDVLLQMSEAAMELVDGLGAERVAAEVLSQP